MEKEHRIIRRRPGEHVAANPCVHPVVHSRLRRLARVPQPALDTIPKTRRGGLTLTPGSAVVRRLGHAVGHFARGRQGRKPSWVAPEPTHQAGRRAGHQRHARRHHQSGPVLKRPVGNVVIGRRAIPTQVRRAPDRRVSGIHERRIGGPIPVRERQAGGHALKLNLQVAQEIAMPRTERRTAVRTVPAGGRRGLPSHPRGIHHRFVMVVNEHVVGTIALQGVKGGGELRDASRAEAVKVSTNVHVGPSACGSGWSWRPS